MIELYNNIPLKFIILATLKLNQHCQRATFAPDANFRQVYILQAGEDASASTVIRAFLERSAAAGHL